MSEETNSGASVPSMRASNDDREQVAAVLQKAMSAGQITVAELESRLDTVYAAKTLAELQPTIADLPGHGVSLAKSTQSAPVSARIPMVHVTSGSRSTANLVAIMSGVTRRGAWVAPTHINCVAVMGGVELDFSSAQLSGMETTVTVTAIMGGVDVTVPPGMTVRVQGVGIMGAFEDNAHQTYGPGAPVLELKGVALMGGVTVKRTSRSIE